MFVLDSHCDTPSQIIRGRDLSSDNDHAHVDFPKLRRGGVDAAFFALYVPARLDYDADKAYEYAMQLLAGLNESIAGSSDACLATSAEKAYENKREGRFSVFIGLENGAPIGESFERLRYFHEAGVRYVTLCHSRNNHICDSCATLDKKWGGLSPFGRKLIPEMNRIGMLIDVSHVSDDTFYDVIALSSKPVVATHSCCRTLADHPRNMTDDMIRALASAGGVIQINFYPVFLDSGFEKVLKDSGIIERGECIESQYIADPSDPVRRMAWNMIQDELKSLPRPSYKRIVDHIDHVVSLVGTDHVGVGSDFDGIEVTPDGMEDISMMSKVFEEMKSRGYSESDIAKIAGLNFLRVLEASTSSGA